MRARTLVRVAALATMVTAATPLVAGAGDPWGPGYFPNVALTTQDGKVVHFYDDLLRGKAVAVDLIYTSCTSSCPLETAKMVQLQRLLGDRVGKDIFFYSISIDPEHDTPEVLKAYAQRFHAGPGWLFLTGKKEDIRLIGQKLGLTSVTDAANRDGHQTSLMVGDVPTRRWMRNSAVDDPRFLARTIGSFLGWKSAEPARSYAEVGAAPEVDRGAYVFKSHCAACHTIGKGDAVGPDLAGLFGRRDHCWVGRYITEPDKMLAEKDPVAVDLFAKYKGVRMPNLNLGPDDVAAVVSHLQKQGREVQKPAEVARGEAPKGVSSR